MSRFAMQDTDELVADADWRDADVLLTAMTGIAEQAQSDEEMQAALAWLQGQMGEEPADALPFRGT